MTANTNSELFRAGARMRTAESKLREGQIREAKLVAERDASYAEVQRLREDLAQVDAESKEYLRVIEQAQGHMNRAYAELGALKVADARRIVVMTDHVVAVGPCAHADEESDDGTCLRLACSYCGLVRVADAVTADEESAAREMLAKQEADNG